MDFEAEITALKEKRDTGLEEIERQDREERVLAERQERDREEAALAAKENGSSVANGAERREGSQGAEKFPGEDTAMNAPAAEDDAVEY